MEEVKRELGREVTLTEKREKGYQGSIRLGA